MMLLTYLSSVLEIWNDFNLGRSTAKANTIMKQVLASLATRVAFPAP